MSSEANAERQFGMVINLAACVGCHACVLACKQEHAVPVEHFNTWIVSWDAGTHPATKRANLPKLCNHCVDAPCATVCPTGATYISEDGIVLLDEEKCIGCQYCRAACPYQVRWLEEEEGVVHKCTFCSDRARAGLLPACVGICPTQARLFGDLNDPESDVSRALAANEGESLLPELGIDTRVKYIGLSRMMEMPVTSAVMHGGRVVSTNEEGLR